MPVLPEYVRVSKLVSVVKAEAVVRGGVITLVIVTSNPLVVGASIVVKSDATGRSSDTVDVDAAAVSVSEERSTTVELDIVTKEKEES